MTTLSQLLALPELELRLVQAGPGDPEVTWLSITELLDLGAYLDGGEVILTTGLALGLHDARWLDFVASLSRARIAAIGFGVGVNHERVPPPLLRAASAYRMALFEVPLPTPFIAVGKAVAELLRADELRTARQALRVQQRLLDGAHGEQEPAEVLAAVSQATGRHLALLADGELIASTAGYAAAMAGAEAHASARPGSTEFVSLDPEHRLRLAIAGGEPLTAEGRSVIAVGAMVLGIGAQIERAGERRERERWSRFTTGLLAGELDPAVALILDGELELPESIRALGVQGDAEGLAAWREEPRTDLGRLVTGPETDVETLPAGLGRSWQLCADTDGSLGRALERAAAHGLDAVVGRSAPVTGARLSRLSAEAKLDQLATARAARSSTHRPRAVWVDRDSPLLDALQRLDPAHGTLAAGVLGPLAATAPDADPRERSLLRETLIAVFRAGGHRGPAAAALGIHRNTLRDRLARIERLTGRSLADPDHRAELWLALRLDEERR